MLPTPWSPGSHPPPCPHFTVSGQGETSQKEQGGRSPSPPHLVLLTSEDAPSSPKGPRVFLSNPAPTVAASCRTGASRGAHRPSVGLRGHVSLCRPELLWPPVWPQPTPRHTRPRPVGGQKLPSGQSPGSRKGSPPAGDGGCWAAVGLRVHPRPPAWPHGDMARPPLPVRMRAPLHSAQLCTPLGRPSMRRHPTLLQQQLSSRNRCRCRTFPQHC